MTQNLQNKGIVLFDGHCNLCSWSVQFIIKREHKNYFRFASLQSKITKSILGKFNLPYEFEKSVILIENDNIYFKSDAALRITRSLNGYWKYFYYFIYVPRFIRDFVYELISKNRYRWFGRKTECFLPKEEYTHYFL